MCYIVEYCITTAGGEIHWWDWENGGEYNEGSFMDSYDPVFLHIDGVWSGNKMKFIAKDGTEWDLDDGNYPTRWLYEDFEEEYNNGRRRWLYEDFEEEYNNGRRLCIEKHKLKKEKTKTSKLQQKAEKETLKASAIAKLTLQEKKALGLK